MGEVYPMKLVEILEVKLANFANTELYKEGTCGALSKRVQTDVIARFYST